MQQYPNSKMNHACDQNIHILNYLFSVLYNLAKICFAKVTKVILSESKHYFILFSFDHICSGDSPRRNEDNNYDNFDNDNKEEDKENDNDNDSSDDVDNKDDEEEKEEEEVDDDVDDDDIEIERKKDDDNFDSISEGDLKKKMSQQMAIKIERKKDDDNFNVISEGDLKKKCLNMWQRLLSPNQKMRIYSSPFVVVI